MTNNRMTYIKNIGGKYYDYFPTNQSFLDTASELKTLGIKNYYFMLRINNPQVAMIDIWNPKITKQEMQMVFRELHTNMWYHARVVARVRTTAGILPLYLDRGLCASMWCLERYQDSLLCKPRQTYKTTNLIAGPLTWAFQFGSQNSHFKFMGKDAQNTKDNLAHLKDDISLLPKWMQFTEYIEDGKIKKSRSAAESVRNDKFKNRASMTASASSHSAAVSIGRGQSAPMKYWDEFEFTPFMDVILANSSPAFMTAHENARAIGAPSARIFSTTPGDLDTEIGRRAEPILESMMPWSERLYDMSDEQIEEYKSQFKLQYHSDPTKPRTREVIDVFYIEYSYKQLRRDYNWVMEQFKASGDKGAIRREIFLQRLRGSADSAVDQEDIEYLISNVKDPSGEIMIDNKWALKLYNHDQKTNMFGEYVDFDQEVPYLIGIDPAGGGAGDNTAITIVDPYSLKIAAEFKSKYIPVTSLNSMILSLIDLIPNGILIIERNSLGIGVIQRLVEETSIGHRVYWSNSEDQVDAVTEEDDADFDTIQKAHMWRNRGVYTTTKNRKQMFEILFRHIYECKDILLTKNIVHDICSLVTNKNTKRVEAAKGQHDDSIMSYLLTMFVWYYGDNLAHFGFFKGDHPIFDVAEEGYAEKIAQNHPLNNINSPDIPITYDDIFRETAMQVNQQMQYLRFQQPKVYGNNIDSNGSIMSRSATNVVIPASFFDEMNGF